MPAKTKTSDKGKSPADFWFSVLILIFVLEFFISVAALCYGLLTTPPRRPGEAFRLAFPLAGWVSAMLIAPVAVLGIARLSLSGSSAADEAAESAWAERLPERARKFYALLRGAPLVVIGVAVLILAATILTIDSALSMLQAVMLALVPYAPFLVGGLTLGGVAAFGVLAWYRYRMNRLQAEYAYRMQVLDKTGVILVDTAHGAILPEGSGYELRALEHGTGPVVSEVPALPSGKGHAGTDRDTGKD